MNTFEKSSYIELKTLEYYFKGDKNKAEDVYKIRHCLKSDGFELFIKYYFEKLGFKMSNISGEHPDGGIDLKGFLESHNVYIQCKKHFKNHYKKGNTKVGEIRNFFGGVVSIDKSYIDSLKIFISTLDYTSTAREFAENNNIELWDYTDIASICEVYNFEDFEKDLINKGINTEKFISSYQYGIAPIHESELDENDIYIYLSNIREQLAVKHKKDTQTGFIYKNTSLRIFAQNRPQNFKGLKHIGKYLENDIERSHIDFYGREIIKGLNLLR